MRKARKTLFGVLVAFLLAAVAFAVPAGSAAAAADGSGSPSAVAAKKRCKKGFVRRGRKCKKKQVVGGGAAYAEGRYSGRYTENGGNLYFSVAGGRMYTEGRDSFALSASCSDGSTDYTPIAPVQASINNGAFAASGNYTPGFGQVIPWSVSGQIAGRSVSNGVFTVGPYNDFYGNTCRGTAHFSAEWCQVPSACVSTPVYPVYPIIVYQRGAERR